MTDASSRILVARQLAGLRRHQWSTLDAVGFVAAALPPGELRGLCERSLQSMREGQPAPTRPGDLFERTLARGEAALPETFDALAQALEAREQAQVGIESAVLLAILMLAGPLLVGAFFGWLAPFATLWIGVPLNAVTRLHLTVILFLKWAGLPLAALVGWLARSWLKGRGPGTRSLEAAANLLEFAASGATGAREFGLNPQEQKFFLWRESTSGAAAAARDTAAVLQQEGLRGVTAFNDVVPLAAAMAAAMIGGTFFMIVVVPLYLPIFKIAGQIH